MVQYQDGHKYKGHKEYMFKVQSNGKPKFLKHAELWLNSAPESSESKALTFGICEGFRICGATESNRRQVLLPKLISWFLGGNFPFIFTTHQRSCVGNQSLLAIAVLLLVSLSSNPDELKPLPTPVLLHRQRYFVEVLIKCWLNYPP